MVNTGNKLTAISIKYPQRHQPNIADKNWRHSMRPRKGAVSLHDAAHTTQKKAVSPSTARTTPKDTTIHITSWKTLGAAQRTCQALWKDLEKKGGTYKQEIIDKIFRHITKLEEALLDAKRRIRFKYGEKRLDVTMRTKEGRRQIATARRQIKASKPDIRGADEWAAIEELLDEVPVLLETKVKPRQTVDKPRSTRTEPEPASEPKPTPPPANQKQHRLIAGDRYVE